MIKRKNWFMRHKWWSLFILAFCVLVCATVFTAKKVEQKKFVTMDITRGDISQTVTATGEIMPVNTVSVGSQVSGTIEEIFVDYNSLVKKGDKLLTIEPSVLQASVDEAKASLDAAVSETDAVFCPAKTGIHIQSSIITAEITANFFIFPPLLNVRTSIVPHPEKVHTLLF